MNETGCRERPSALRDGIWGSLAFGLIALALLAIAPLAQAAPGGGLRQFGSTKGCIVDEAATPSGCEDVRALQGVNGDMVMSPNGRQLYVPAETKQAIVVFNRDPATGALTQKSGANGCITVNATTATNDGCATAASSQLAGVKGLAVSPDGKNLYAVNTNGSLIAFNIDSEGNLTFNSAAAFCSCDLRTVAVSPDGLNLYPAGPGTFSGGGGTFGGIVGVYRRDPANGIATNANFRQYFSGDSGGTVVPALQAPANTVVTPDNKQLIVSNSEGLACCDWSVLAFDRATSGGNVGDLTAPSGTTRCVSGTTTAGCQTRPGQSYPSGLAISDGGRSIQVAAYETITTITRDPSTGNLTANPAGRCITYSTITISGCSSAGGPFADFANMRGLAVTPDGTEMYSGSQNANGGLWGYNRGGDGSFSLKPKPFGCATLNGSSSCSSLRGAVPNRTIVAAPGNRNIYAAGGNRLFSFVTDRAPVCDSVGTGTAHNTAVGVQLSCSDPDGDEVSYEIVVPPARGSLGAVQGSTVTYGPLVGTSGQDSFTYRAVAAGVPSDPATVTVDVAGPPAPPPPSGGTVPPRRILGITMPFAFSKSTKKYTVFTLLQIKGIPSASTLKVTCKAPKGKKCPAKSWTKRNAKGTVSLKKWLKKRLPAGSKLTATITKSGRIGAVKIMTVKKRARPSFADRCLKPGAKKPTRC